MLFGQWLEKVVNDDPAHVLNFELLKYRLKALEE